MAWAIETTKAFDDWFGDLGDAEQVEVVRLIALLTINGPALSRPHADTLNGSAFANMKELRGRTATAAIRIAFAFDRQRVGVILVGGAKQGVSEKRFYKSLVATADKLFAAHLAAKKPR